MDLFEITTDKEGNKGVSCVKRQLYMKAIPEETEFAQDLMIIVANLGNEFDSATNIYLQVLYTNLDREFKKWDMDLFFAAAEYFCQVELDSEPTGFELVNQQNFYPYEKGDLTY